MVPMIIKGVGWVPEEPDLGASCASVRASSVVRGYGNLRWHRRDVNYRM